VSDFPVILMGGGKLAGRNAEGGAELAPVGYYSSQARMRRQFSSRQSENPRDIHPGHREVSRHALRPTKGGVVSRPTSRVVDTRDAHLGITREWPRAIGPMSKKEKLVRYVRDRVHSKKQPIRSRFLGLDEFERRDLSYVYSHSSAKRKTQTTNP